MPKATLTWVEPGFRWFAVCEVDDEKVEALRLHLREGGKVPPQVLVNVDGSFMPLDGHHRTTAHELEGLGFWAWVISNRVFSNLDIKYGAHAEDHVLCDGVPAMQVAEKWRECVDTRQ